MEQASGQMELSGGQHEDPLSDEGQPWGENHMKKKYSWSDAPFEKSPVVKWISTSVLVTLLL